jgi:hypothetical protein
VWYYTLPYVVLQAVARARQRLFLPSDPVVCAPAIRNQMKPRALRMSASRKVTFSFNCWERAKKGMAEGETRGGIPIIFRGGALRKVLVLQRKPQEGVGALALKLKFAAHAGAVVLDGSVVDGKLGADFFAGFAAGNQLHDAELGRC